MDRLEHETVMDRRDASLLDRDAWLASPEKGG
jgi:hypothetical protein